MLFATRRAAISNYFRTSDRGLLTHEDWYRQARRKLVTPLFRLADTGWLGLVPLQLHALICGFPASGTTLLQLMIENGYPHARRFGTEVSGWRAATYTWRSHPVLISKVPQDLFRLQPLRDFYADRKARLRILLMLRDPRDLYTCQRRRGEILQYVVSTETFVAYREAFVRERNRPDTMVVRYEDLVQDTDREQEKIETFLGEKFRLPFTESWSVDRPDFDKTTLNGLRAVETSKVARWSRPQHAARVKLMLSEVPNLCRTLVDFGYEPDDRWTEAYR